MNKNYDGYIIITLISCICFIFNLCRCKTIIDFISVILGIVIIINLIFFLRHNI